MKKSALGFAIAGTAVVSMFLSWLFGAHIQSLYMAFISGAVLMAAWEAHNRGE